MSDGIDFDLDVIVAGIGYNDGANNGFWRIQPRDDEGQWIEMGAEILFRFRTGKGNLVVATGRGVYVGPSGRPGYARVMIKNDSKDGLKSGVYEVESRNLQQFKALLPDSALDGKKSGARKDKFGKPVQTLEDSKLPDLNNLLSGRKDITSEDQRLAKGDLTPAERSAEADGRAKSPIADLPAGFEAANPEETKKLLKESGIDPAEYDKSNQDSSSSADPIIMDALADVAYNGDTTETVDSLIQKAEAAPKVKATKALNLNRGDVILGNDGKQYKIAEIDLEAARMRLLDENGKLVGTLVDDPKNPGKTKLVPRDFKVNTAGEYKVVQQPKKGVDKPAKPAPNPEGPKPPRTPKAPKTAKPETPKTPEAPSAPQGGERKLDDGELIPQQRFSDEELATFRKANLENLIGPDGEAQINYNSKGEAYNTKDPNAMMNFLANAYQDAKFNDAGHLVLMRENSTENGKNIQWEIRAAITGDKKIAYMIHFKDLNTNEEKTLMYKDQRDSMQSLFGKTNNPQVLADILTGKYQPRYNERVDTKNARDPEERAKYFAAQGRTKTLADHAKYYSNGYAERINRNNGTLLEKEVLSTFKAYEEGNREAVAERLRAVFGRAPVDEQSHEIVRTALREEFAAKFPNTDKRIFNALVTSASNFYRKQMFDDPNSTAIPYSSANKVIPIEVGDVVEYTNNIGEVSVVKVAARQRANFANPIQSDDQFGYGDYVSIVDVNGKRSSLPTTNLRILKDQNTELTEYKGRVSGRRLREERGVLYNPGTLRFPGQGNVPDKVMPVDDMVPGDNFYGKDGSNLGVIIESVPITGKDGKKGYGIMYMNKDGDLRKVAVAAGEQRGPNVVTSNADSVPQKIRTVEADVNESDPSFDLDNIPFETDPNTVERPKTVGLDFNVPANAKRNAEQQLNLNDEVQKEIDSMASDLAASLGDGWKFDTSSFNAKSYFTAGELGKLVDEARAQYPDLTDEEIRTLLELKHSKQRGFFAMTKQKMIDDILREAAIFRKDEGGVQDLRFDIKLNKDSGKLELGLPEGDLAKYMSAVEGVDKFINKNPQLKSLVDGSDEGHYIRIVNSESLFSSLYNSIGKTWIPEDTRGVLGVNISSPRPDGSGKWDTAILINQGSLASGAKPAGDFGEAAVHTFIHEFGHTIGNKLARLSNGRSRLGDEYSQAAKDFITSYGQKSKDEHFADSFAKWIMTGEAAPSFLDFLKSFDVIDSVDLG